MSYEMFGGSEVTPQTSIANPIPGLKYLLIRVFGCWHRNMSKPFGRDGKNYRDCLDCGARRDLDDNRKMVGSYYFIGAKR